jgi:hypothetical protein
MVEKTPEHAADSKRIHSLVEGYRAGEDPDLSRLSSALWDVLFAKIPSLTVSKHKSDQHRILEQYLVSLGLPPSPDLQYIAGPVLWYAREKHVVPPAQAAEMPAESWTLDAVRYEEARKTLDEGRTTFGDWMTNALRTLLAEQQ